MEYEAGQLILNQKYRIEELIGRGAFGAVYRVTHLGLNVARAIKVQGRHAPGMSSEEYEGDL